MKSIARNKLLFALWIIAATFTCTSNAAVVLYSQNFENPNPGSFVNDGGDVNIFRPINTLYGGQPAGFNFAQTNTVETLLVGGSQAWGTGFKDPQGIAGQHVISMLSSVQNDLLGLSFNLNNNKFLNFKVDISSIDLDRWGGPFVPTGGFAPKFQFSLFDNPGGESSIGGGTLLSSVTLSGSSSPLKNTFDWTNFIVSLNASGNTNGNVILQIDELEGGYAALDNFVIAASDTPGDIGQVPLPGAIWLFSSAIASYIVATHRKLRT